MLCRPLRVWSVPPPELSGWCANLLHGGGLMVTSLLNQASQRMVTCFWWDPCAVYRARLDALPLLRLPFCSLQRPEGVAYFLELILYLFLAIGQIAHDWKLSLVSACRPLLESFQHWYKTIEWKPLSLQLCSASSMREGGHRAGATRQAQLGLVTWARRAPRSQRSEEPSAVTGSWCVLWLPKSKCYHREYAYFPNWPEGPEAVPLGSGQPSSDPHRRM